MKTEKTEKLKIDLNAPMVTVPLNDAQVPETMVDCLGNYLNIYRLTLCYGGPEEGGWSYNALDCIASIEVDRLNPSQKLALQALLEIQYPHKQNLSADEYWSYSRMQGNDHEVYFEEEKAQRQTKEIPRYE